MATLKAHGGKVASITISTTSETRTTFVLCADGAVLKAVQVAGFRDDVLGNERSGWTAKSYTLAKPKGTGTRSQLVAWKLRTLGQLRNAVLISEEGLAPFEVVADLVPAEEADRRLALLAR